MKSTKYPRGFPCTSVVSSLHTLNSESLPTSPSFFHFFGIQFTMEIPEIPFNELPTDPLLNSSPPHLLPPNGGGDDDKPKYKDVFGLSTVLVASIQDAKERIAQIEHIFCTLLFPNLKSNSNSFRNILESLQIHKDKQNALSLTLDRLRVDNEAKRHRIEELEVAEREREFRDCQKRKSRQNEIEGFEREKKVLLEKIGELEKKLSDRSREVEEIGEYREKLRLENEGVAEKVRVLEERVSKAEGSCREMSERLENAKSKLIGERTKKNRLVEAYKKLKSQHNYLRRKVGITEENMIQQNKSEDLFAENSETSMDACNAVKVENEIPEDLGDGAFENCDTSKDACKAAKVKSEIPEEHMEGLENTNPDVFVAACDTIKVKKILEDVRGADLSPPPSIFRVPRCPSNTKPVSVSGTKRRASSWRQTRAHQSRAGPDLHDDFLDTPLENVRENLNRELIKEDLPNPIEEDIVMNSSDDETQNLNLRSSPLKKQSSIQVVNKRSFKYIEPVRKKAERENLKGVECKQCRKFYEAVLPSADGKDHDVSEQNFRCEHHDGVSRHRYRYVPPMTPEGFWNIGFESEM
ncbi:protein gamma response 1 isoform X2 [Arachis duranensis]|uniref:Protein gamma response 1 isoform X2 n=1 Tax=Arachis duranensis TaxID=130453 RepID=A0A6P4C371_ARADU|nr:protein gamma response 1 isoform X2 [Arachis duranensis]